MHGHIKNLIEKGVKFIFYPSIPHEKKEYENANNSFNCPIVVSYPEVISKNLDDLKENDVIEMFRELIMKVVTFGEIMLRLKTPENLRIM